MIFVDKGNTNNHEVFAYHNKDGQVEFVEANISDPTADIRYGEDSNRLSEIYYEDIPKLILALQAAYDFKFKDLQ